MKNLLEALVSLSLICLGNLKIEEEKYDLIIEAEKYLSVYLWKDSTFGLYSNVSNPLNIFDQSDIEKQIIETKLRVENSIALKIKCHLWYTKLYPLTAICDLKDAPPNLKNIKFSIDEYIFTYKSKRIKFYSNKIEAEVKKIPFIYSDLQILDLDDKNDVYYLNFKTGLFYDTNLCVIEYYLNRYIHYLPLDKCDVKDRNMTCKITRKKIESFLWDSISNESYFTTLSFSSEYGVKVNYFDRFIKIIKKEKKKETVYVKVKSLLTYPVKPGSMLAYETNITDISALETIKFELKFIADKTQRKEKCYLKKNEDDKPLMLLCLIDHYAKNLTWEEHQDNYLLTELSCKYNFMMIYPKNETIITETWPGTYIMAKYPDTLDFTSEDELNFTVLNAFRTNITNPTLNPKSEYLNCEAPIYGFINCIVPKSHFKGEKSGYYYLHYTNFLGEQSIYYEVTPFKGILSSNIISCMIDRVFLFLILLIFL